MMEMVSVYLFNRIPIETDDFNNKTFHRFKKNGWYNDSRSSHKFVLLNKRIEVEEKWYRVMIRFEFQGLIDDFQESYNLSNPVPFLVTECEPLVGGNRWRDIKTYHGRNIGSASAFIESGIPSEVIEKVNEDLRKFAVYN